ncbi:hypothetical protein MTO96_030864 [Rhipicephalus appendiculatus]
MTIPILQKVWLLQRFAEAAKPRRRLFLGDSISSLAPSSWRDVKEDDEEDAGLRERAVVSRARTLGVRAPVTTPGRGPGPSYSRPVYDPRHVRAAAAPVDP